MTATSPWSREAPPAAIVPPAQATSTWPPPPYPATQAPPPQPPSKNGRRFWAAASATVLTMVLSAAVSAIVAYTITDTAAISANSARPTPVAVPSSASPPTPRFSAAETAAAKDHLCAVFDISVRGQGDQGGLRTHGQLNIPVVLRGLNSASAVQNALVPAVPADVTAAAQRYISATLDQTTAAMGNPPTSEVNRLTDIRNEVTYTLLDLCGLPR